LAGCGGGGGGGGASPPAAGAPPVAQRDVQGTVAKGLIKGAKVSVYPLDVQGVRASAALATATTAGDGTYKLQLPTTLRNFVIEVGAAPGAVMADEATGTDIALPASLKLRSIVTLAENAAGSYQGSVSPLTEMVVRTAETADGKLPPQAVAQAKASVRTLLGFDPETVKPVNSNSAAAATASEDEKNQSLALAAISKMASTATADCGQSNAGERIACVVSKLAASVIIKDGQPSLDPGRLVQFRDAIVAVAQDKTINHTGKDKVVGIPVLTPPPVTPPATPVPPPTETTPVPPPVGTTPVPPPVDTTPVPPPVGTTPPPLAATKTLFGSLRTNLRALGEGDAFRSTADAVRADLGSTIAPFGNDVGGFATLAMSALENFERYRVGANPRYDFKVVNNQLLDALPQRSVISLVRGEGDCLIRVDPLSMECTVVQDEYLDGTMGDATNGTRVYATRTFTLQPKDGTVGEYTYTTSLARNMFVYEGFTIIVDPTRETLGGTFPGEVSYTRSGDTATKLSFHGRMPGRLNKDGSFRSDAEDWSLDAARTVEAGGSALYTFGGEFSASRAGQVTGKLVIDDASFLRLAPAGNELRVTLRGSVGSTAVAGTLRASAEKLDKSRTVRIPTVLSFEGALEHKDAMVFSGNVAITRGGFENFDATAALSDTNFVADTVEMGGWLSVPQRPALSLSLGATRTGPGAASISAQYRDGTSVINASVTARAGERYPLVKVASADGVAFSFAGRSAPVQVTKDGAVTAEIDFVRGIISYSDGSTESLL
jgi:hypothetical protein